MVLRPSSLGTTGLPVTGHAAMETAIILGRSFRAGIPPVPFLTTFEAGVVWTPGHGAGAATKRRHG